MTSYFGYGTNRSYKMVESLFGRIPENFPAEIEDYGLFIQFFTDIPEEVRKMLSRSWDNSFRAYAITPMTGKKTRGRVWDLTTEEMRVLEAWEFYGKWYFPFECSVMRLDGSSIMRVNSDRRIIPIALDRLVNGEDYDEFLVSPEKISRIAKSVRKEILGV